MYRALYTELLPILGPSCSAKIEVFLRQICDSPVDRVENLNITTIKTVLTSGNNTGMADNFAENATRLLPEPCPICLIAFPRDQMEVMFLCQNHRCCLPCLKNHYRTAINAIQGKATLNRLTCFHTPHPIEEDMHDNFFAYLNPKVCSKEDFSIFPWIFRFINGLKMNLKSFENIMRKHLKQQGMN